MNNIYYNLIFSDINVYHTYDSYIALLKIYRYAYRVYASHIGMGDIADRKTICNMYFNSKSALETAEIVYSTALNNRKSAEGTAWDRVREVDKITWDAWRDSRQNIFNTWKIPLL